MQLDTAQRGFKEVLSRQDIPGLRNPDWTGDGEQIGDEIRIDGDHALDPPAGFPLQQ